MLSIHSFHTLHRGSHNYLEYEMITSVRFCLSYDLLNVILSPSKFVYFTENLHLRIEFQIFSLYWVMQNIRLFNV